MGCELGGWVVGYLCTKGQGGSYLGLVLDRVPMGSSSCYIQYWTLCVHTAYL